MMTLLIDIHVYFTLCVYPAPAIIIRNRLRFFPDFSHSVNRIDDVYGDRNLKTTCPLNP